MRAAALLVVVSVAAGCSHRVRDTNEEPPIVHHAREPLAAPVVVTSRFDRALVVEDARALQPSDIRALAASERHARGAIARALEVAAIATEVRWVDREQPRPGEIELHLGRRVVALPSPPLWQRAPLVVLVPAVVASPVIFVFPPYALGVSAVLWVSMPVFLVLADWGLLEIEYSLDVVVDDRRVATYRTTRRIQVDAQAFADRRYTTTSGNPWLVSGSLVLDALERADGPAATVLASKLVEDERTLGELRATVTARAE